MPKTFSQVQAQIEKLQREAEVLRKKEIAGVVARIREAVEFYKLEPADVFGDQARTRRLRKVPADMARDSQRKSRPMASKSTSKDSAQRTSKGTKVPVKYRDQAGNEWSGRGSRPRWLVAALSEGKALDSFLVG